MPKAGDDHLRRAQIEAAKQILRTMPGSPRPKARERDAAVAEAIGAKPRHAKGIRLDAERELQAEQAGNSGGGIRYLDDLADLVSRAELLFQRSIELEQLSAAAGALKQLHALMADLAKWRGERPPDPDAQRGPAKPAMFDLGPEPADG